MAASMAVEVLDVDNLFAACEFEGCPLGTDGLCQCSMSNCRNATHRTCFHKWANGHGVPVLPGLAGLCRECAEEVCLTATNRVASKESIEKHLGRDSQPNRGEVEVEVELHEVSEVSSPPSLPDSTVAVEMDDSTWTSPVVAKLYLDPDSVSDRVKLQLTPRSTFVTWHADDAVENEAATPQFWVACPSPLAAGVSPHDTGMGPQPPTPGRRETTADPAAEVEAAPVSKIGTRCCIRGLNGVVWDQRNCSETDVTYLAVIFDNWLTREWESYPLQEFESLATAPETVAADDIAAVFICKQVGKGSLPSAVLSGALEKENKNHFYAFSHYRPLPPSDMHSDPPIPFALEPGTIILCQQPCVSSGSARDRVIPSDEVVVVEYCGILVAENSFKLDKKPYNRWVVCLQGDEAVIFPFSSIVSLADASQRATLPRESGPAACANTLAAAHLDGRTPGELEKVYKAALNKLSANAPEAPASTGRHLSEDALNKLSASAPEALASTGRDLRERRKPPLAHDAPEKEHSAGLRTRRGRAAAPSSAQSSSAPSETPSSSSAHVSDRSSARRGTTASEIPLGLRGWGVSKLDACTLAQLCLSLTENGLEQPPKHIVDKSGWAKNALMTRLELLPFSRLNPPPQKKQGSNICVCALCVWHE